MKGIVGTFRRNLKAEIVVVVISIIFYIWQKYFPSNFIINIDLLSYFEQDRLNGIAAFFAITIGVYVAVITVLATSEIGISKEMLRKNLDKPLIDIIITGIAENFITVGLAIFIPLNLVTAYVLIVFLIVSIVSFVKFTILLVVIFKANMNQMAKAIDEENQYKDRILAYLNNLACYFQNHSDK